MSAPDDISVPGDGPLVRSAAGDVQSRWAAAGGIAGAVAASSCCILPLVLFSLGATGVWIGQLAALMPYQPIFVLFAVAALGYGFYVRRRTVSEACDDTQVCVRPAAQRVVTVALWSASLLVVAAIAFPYAAPFILG